MLRGAFTLSGGVSAGAWGTSSLAHQGNRSDLLCDFGRSHWQGRLVGCRGRSQKTGRETTATVQGTEITDTWTRRATEADCTGTNRYPPLKFSASAELGFRTFSPGSAQRAAGQGDRLFLKEDTEALVPSASSTEVKDLPTPEALSRGQMSHASPKLFAFHLLQIASL